MIDVREPLRPVVLCPKCAVPRYVLVQPEAFANAAASSATSMVITCKCDDCGAGFRVTVSVTGETESDE